MEGCSILPDTKTCTNCNIEKSLVEFYNDKRAKDNKQSQCKKCDIKNSIIYRQEHRSKKSEYDKKRYQENKDEIRRKGGYQSMYENKNCSLYLGVVIAERLIRHLFKDVQVMPNGNPKFDFICNKGMKIDVKARCIEYNNKTKNPRWKFDINQNKIADFFIFVAFDNLTDLNPLHLWMIPGKEINNQGSAQIAPSTIHKWDKYKKDIKVAQSCCVEMKASK